MSTRPARWLPDAPAHTPRSRHLLIALIIVAEIYPLFWILTNSFKSQFEFLNSPLLSLPTQLLFDNCVQAWTTGDLGRNALNSLIVTLPSLFLIIVLGAAAGFALEVMIFRGPHCRAAVHRRRSDGAAADHPLAAVHRYYRLGLCGTTGRSSSPMWGTACRSRSTCSRPISGPCRGSCSRPWRSMAARRGIVVVDTTNSSSDPVAEGALWLTLVGLRNAGALFRRLVAGEALWPDRTVFMTDPGYLHGELTGKTVGLIALGNVGRRLPELLDRAAVLDPHAARVIRCRRRRPAAGQHRHRGFSA